MAEQWVRVVDVRVEPFEVETGYWCNACMLGSGLRVIFAVKFYGADGSSMLQLQNHFVCDECESGADVVRVRDGNHT